MFDESCEKIIYSVLNINKKSYIFGSKIYIKNMLFIENIYITRIVSYI